MTADELKASIAERRARRNTGYGGIGERIFAAVLRRRGRAVQSIHANGVDFLVDGERRVDVKTTVAFGKAVPTTLAPHPRSQRMPGVHYPRVVMCDACVLVSIPEVTGSDAPVTVEWDDVLTMLDDTTSGTARSGHSSYADTVAQKATVARVEQMIATQWGLRAKVVYRGNPAAQKAMGKWGPESFYHDPVRNPKGFDLVVLIYFDGARSLHVFAYPMHCSADIVWRKKAVGPNIGRRMTFDPSALSNRFQFRDLGEFEREFRARH